MSKFGKFISINPTPFVMKGSDYFTKRRTIRQYSDRKIDSRMLEELLEAASHAPTTGNMQLYSVIITEDQARKELLSPAHFNQPSVMSAAAVLTFCADFNRFEKWCEAGNAEPGYDNFQAWLWAVEDTMIFAQQFVTLAELNGLGTCYLGTTTYNAPQISEILKLLKRVVPVTTITVGYPANEGFTSDRIPVGGIIHREEYHDYDRQSITDIYAAKEALESSQRFVEENGKSHLAQVFTDVRYPRKDNEYFSKVYIDLVREKGFGF